MGYILVECSKKQTRYGGVGVDEVDPGPSMD